MHLLDVDSDSCEVPLMFGMAQRDAEEDFLSIVARVLSLVYCF